MLIFLILVLSVACVNGVFLWEQSKKSRKSNQASTKPPKDELPNGAESHGNKKRKTIAG